MPMPATRTRYLAAAVGTIALGLAVHQFGTGLGPSARDVAGDALWAIMMTWWVSALYPNARLWLRGGSALAICFAVETSQLYHTPALDAMRGTFIGNLTLGSGFDPRDFLSYTLGVLVAALLEWTVTRRR